METHLHSFFKDRIQRHSSAPGDVLILPASISSVVSFYASYTSAPDFSNGDEVIRDLAVSMCDKGTVRRDKLQIASAIEDVGGQISFSSNGIRCSVSGKALAQDLPMILGLVREQLIEPSFPAEEFLWLKERYLASFQQSLLDTGSLAGIALSQAIFPSDHPNYSSDPREDIKKLQSITVDQVRQYYYEKMPIEDWRMAIVGDVDASLLTESALVDFPESTMSYLKPWPSISARKPEREKIEISLPDRDNIDVRIGHAIGLERTNPDYLPLMLGVFVLGGNFSARLMQIIRDEMGLTYGISSSVSGVDPFFSGQWKTSVTLSSNRLREGIQATLDELNRFVDAGVTETELAIARETVAGAYSVGLSTTGSLARAIVNTRERGDDLDYMDRFPHRVRSITVREVNRVIRNYLDAGALTVSMAGTLPGS